MQVEILHGDDLRVTTAGGATLNAEGRTLRWLADHGDDFLSEMRTKRLTNTDSGGGLAFAQGGGGDGGHIDVFAILAFGETIKDLKFDLGFVGTEEFQFAFLNSQFLGDLEYGFEFACLGDL